jgi:polysaccharide export outer membrane protein
MSFDRSRWIVSSLLMAGLVGQPAMAAAPAELHAAQSVPATNAQGYTLRYGDTLSILMIGNETPKLENQPIRPDGRVTVPLLGEVRAAGLTVSQLSTALTRDYRRFVRDPRLVVSVAQFRPLKITVLGLVNKPGIYLVTEPTTMLEGLALAGGLDRHRADTRAIEVRHADGTHHVVSLEKILAGQAPNVVMGDGDTVIVAEVSGPDWERLLPHMATTLSIIGSIAVIGWNLRN